MHAARHLLQHPRRAVARPHVLRVEDASVEQRAVRHGDELLASVRRLEGRVRVGQPDHVRVGLQHVDAQLDGQPRGVVLAQVVKVKGEAPVLRRNPFVSGRAGTVAQGEGLGRGRWRTFSAHRPPFFGLVLLMRDDQTQASEGSAERSLTHAAAESLMYNTWCSRRAYSCITVFKPLAEEAVGEESPHTRMSSRR